MIHDVRSPIVGASKEEDGVGVHVSWHHRECAWPYRKRARSHKVMESDLWIAIQYQMHLWPASRNYGKVVSSAFRVYSNLGVW